jgi:hypothetical protein
VRIALAAVALAVLAVIVGTIWVAARVREDTVVARPYEEGLKLGAKARPSMPPPACDVGSAPCAAALPGGGEVRLDAGPRPLRTMQELALRVDLGAGAADEADVSISFSMAGMSMGENRSRLARTAPGRFEGKGILVRCPSGGRGWLADVEVRSPGAPARAARFSLTVAE